MKYQPVKQLPRAPRASPEPVVVSQPVRMLMCDTCGTWTPHVLDSSKSNYVCGCGSAIEYHININPHLWGVR